jgi:hypothetical protein
MNHQKTLKQVDVSRGKEIFLILGGTTAGFLNI